MNFYTSVSQDVVDVFLDRLLEDGVLQQCGWPNDKFGVSCQIVPRILPEMMQDKDPENSTSRASMSTT